MRLARPLDLRLLSGGASLQEAGGPFVDEIYDAVVDLPPAERDAALARWADFPAVVADVRALLAATDADPPPPPHPEPAAGDHFGPFRLEERLGAGSSGAVWRAFDDHLQAWTALKIFRPRAADDLDRVLREARAASAILSDHVVRVKSAGRFADGPYYLEMQLAAEYRPGLSGERIEVGRSLAELPAVSIDDAVRMVAEAARGVEDAHRIGVVHRDVKPANILVLPVSGRALVTDFGLAAPGLHHAPTESTPATSTVTVSTDGGRIVGTPAFMAPEQANGVFPGRTSDVYALGATLYTLLAGRPPYVPLGLDPIPALDVIRQVRAGPPGPLPPVVPARLTRILDRAMARVPADRYPTAASLAGDLEAWSADQLTTVDRRSVTLWTYLFARRNREVVTTATVLAMLLLMSALALVWLEQRREALEIAAQQADARRVVAEGRAIRADGVREQAEAERDAALRESLAALDARDLARLGESAATRRETDAVEARQIAEDAARAAIVARLRAEQAASTEVAVREALQAELNNTQEARARLEADLGESLSARVQLESDLRAALDARLQAEADRDVAEQAWRAATAEVDALRSALSETDGAQPIGGVE